MGNKGALDTDETIDFMVSCWDAEAGQCLVYDFFFSENLHETNVNPGAFGAHPNCDTHVCWARFKFW